MIFLKKTVLQIKILIREATPKTLNWVVWPCSGLHVCTEHRPSTAEEGAPV